MPVVIFQRTAAYVILIAGKQSETNLTLNTFLYGRREIKGQSMLQHVYMYPECSATSLIEKIIVPSDKTQEMIREN